MEYSGRAAIYRSRGDGSKQCRRAWIECDAPNERGIGAGNSFALGTGKPASDHAGVTKKNPGELPIVAAGDFAGNLKSGRDLLQAGRAKAGDCLP